MLESKGLQVGELEKARNAYSSIINCLIIYQYLQYELTEVPVQVPYEKLTRTETDEINVVLNAFFRFRFSARSVCSHFTNSGLARAQSRGWRSSPHL